MATHTNHDHPSRPITIALPSLLVAAVVSLSLLVMHPTPALAHSMHPSAANAYSCSSSHCYSYFQRYSPDPAGMIGSSVAISVAHLACNGCGINDFVDNEVWLDGPDRNGTGHYWVEAGYSTYSGLYGLWGTYYFWADKRPGGGYYEHPMQAVPAEDYGHNATFWIWKTPGWSDRFSVQEIGWYSDWQGLSTSNSMQVLYTRMGMELSGTSGAHADTAYYTSRYYQNLNTYWYPLGNWAFGDPSSNDPPTGIYGSGQDFATNCTC